MSISNRGRIAALSLSLIALAGCGGSSTLNNASTASITQNIGSFTTRIVGTAQSPVTSSAAFGANVTGIAGALIDQLTLNAQGPSTLSETKIAFTSTRDGNNEIYVTNPDGTSQTRLTNNVAVDFYATWSPNGTKIAFTTTRDAGNYEIYVMNADGSSPTRLTNNAATDYAPSWSPDGTKIAFVSTRDGQTEVYTMNADGTGQTRLTNNAAIDYEPAWSPDGTKIAFTTSRDAGNYDIYTMNADGTNQTRITNNAAVDQTASWSPNGSKIAFSSFRDGNYEIYTMNTDGSSPTRLTNNTSSDNTPAWSPDGTKIAFSSFRDGNYEVYSMNASGGSETNLSKLPSIADEQSSWSGYLPRTPKTLIGAGGTLGTAAAGFLYGVEGKRITSVVAFDTSTVGSRAGARIASQTASETQGTNLIFSITTTVGLASVTYASVSEAGVPGTAISPTIPTGSTGAIVTFDAADGSVVAVLPYAANRSIAPPTHSGNDATYRGNFTAIFDGSGKNLATKGAKSVTIDEKTGKLVRFE